MNEAIPYHDYVLSEDEDRIRQLQELCAGIHADKRQEWDDDDVRAVVAILNSSDEPRRLFRFIDERTGTSYVGYRTRDGREWFHILRQMRNDSDLFHQLLEPAYS